MDLVRFRQTRTRNEPYILLRPQNPRSLSATVGGEAINTHRKAKLRQKGPKLH